MRVDPQVTGHVVREAIKNIKNHGWVQGEFNGPNYGFCMLGAIREACLTYLSKDEVAWAAMYAEIAADLGKWVVNLNGGTPYVYPGALAANVAHFNDAPGRTKEEVLLHMNKYADEVDPQLVGE